jgi:hypothetical protein
MVSESIMSTDSPRLRRLVVESNLDNTLPLWLDAIAQGDYHGAKRILEARSALRAELQHLLAEDGQIPGTGAADAAGSNRPCR